MKSAIRASIGILAGSLVVAAGVYVGARAGTGGDSVVETAPRFREAVAPAPPSRVVPRLSEVVSYLDPMPEPEDEGLRAPRPKLMKDNLREPASPAARISPSAAESVASVPPLVDSTIPLAAGTAGCSAGSRPIGDCDCYNEALGKVSLKLHPTVACVDEESKRLGHRVLLASTEGHYELAGLEPEQEHELEPEGEPSVEGQAESALYGAPPSLVTSVQLVPEIPPAKMPEEPKPPSFVPSAALLNVLLPKAPTPKMPPLPPPPDAPALTMSRCSIGKHDVHLWYTIGSVSYFLHVRYGVHLPPLLEHARDIIMHHGVYDVYISGNKLTAGGTRACGDAHDSVCSPKLRRPGHRDSRAGDGLRRERKSAAAGGWAGGAARAPSPGEGRAFGRRAGGQARGRPRGAADRPEAAAIRREAELLTNKD